MFLDDLVKPHQPEFTRGFIISITVIVLTSVLLLYFAHIVFILLLSILFFMVLPLLALLCAPLWVKAEGAFKTYFSQSTDNQDKKFGLVQANVDKTNEEDLKKSNETDIEDRSKESTEDSQAKSSTINHLFYPANTPQPKTIDDDHEEPIDDKKPQKNFPI